MPAAVAPREVHFRGVLHCDDPTASTGRPRARAKCIHDRRRADPRIVQKAMAGDLTGAVAAKPAQYQRTRRNNPLDQPIAAIRQANVASSQQAHATLHQNLAPHRSPLNHKNCILAITANHLCECRSAAEGGRGLNCWRYRCRFACWFLLPPMNGWTPRERPAPGLPQRPCCPTKPCKSGSMRKFGWRTGAPERI